MWLYISGILGIFGFGLSVALAIGEFISKRPRVKVDDVRLTTMNLDRLLGLAFTFRVTNRSSRALSLIGVSWRVEESQSVVHYPAIQPAGIDHAFEFGDDIPDSMPSIFPVDVPPRLSRRVVVCYRYNTSNPLLDTLADWDKAHDISQHRLTLEQVFQAHPQFRHYLQRLLILDIAYSSPKIDCTNALYIGRQRRAINTLKSGV